MQTIIIRYLTGEKRIVHAESWAQLNSAGSPLGSILLRHDAGGKLYAVKSAIVEVEEIPQAIWDAGVAAHVNEAQAAEAKKLKNRIKRLFRRGKP